MWLSTLDTVDREENGVPLRWGTDEHRAALLAAMDAQVARLTSRGARVVFIAPPFPAPGRLNLQLPEKDQQILRDYHALLIAYTTANADRSAFVELDDLVCPTGYPCPQEVGGTDLRPDGTHFSEESAPIIARQLLPRVLETAARRLRCRSQRAGRPRMRCATMFLFTCVVPPAMVSARL